MENYQKSELSIIYLPFSLSVFHFPLSILIAYIKSFSFDYMSSVTNNRINFYWKFLQNANRFR
jgi:hypothetical protein